MYQTRLESKENLSEAKEEISVVRRQRRRRFSNLSSTKQRRTKEHTSWNFYISLKARPISRLGPFFTQGRNEWVLSFPFTFSLSSPSHSSRSSPRSVSPVFLFSSSRAHIFKTTERQQQQTRATIAPASQWRPTRKVRRKFRKTIVAKQLPLCTPTAVIVFVCEASEQTQRALKTPLVLKLCCV